MVSEFKGLGDDLSSSRGVERSFWRWSSRRWGPLDSVETFISSTSPLGKVSVLHLEAIDNLSLLQVVGKDFLQFVLLSRVSTFFGKLFSVFAADESSESGGLEHDRAPNKRQN